MKICFPVKEANGVMSTIHGHFGSAPFYVIIDDQEHFVDVIENNDCYHQHGHCSPLKGLMGRRVDTVIVNGIGTGAFKKLTALGVNVFQAEGGNVQDNFEMFTTNRLSPIDMAHTCSGH